MSDHSSSNNRPDKNVANINPPDVDPNTNIWGENSLKSFAESRTTGPHHQGADGEGPLMCDYPDTDEDSPTSSLESPQKSTFNDREGQAHKQNGLRTFYDDDDDDDDVSSDELERNDNENLAGRAGSDQNLLKENKPVGEMSKLVDKDIEEEEIDSLLDPKTPEGGDWEPTEECMKRSLDIVSKRLKEWKRSRKYRKKRTVPERCLLT
ncbi:uncharacterized protein H6S33_011995 [Morchella sextelata]|uniref:uncharacterized protein n=1 Tax=Morchella sextelata TaxID=1174677 RepID=UPI001D056561|nr:uncharacterized protein H6S33_011995 [Morchella sextelata]KAH0610468.1 hypothetical protein H6S33_011995 [Morchella sextelata]